MDSTMVQQQQSVQVGTSAYHNNSAAAAAEPDPEEIEVITLHEDDYKEPGFSPPVTSVVFHVKQPQSQVPQQPPNLQQPQQQPLEQPGPSTKKICRRVCGYSGINDNHTVAMLVSKYATISTSKDERRKSMAKYGHPEWEPPPPPCPEEGAEVEICSSDMDMEIKLDLDFAFEGEELNPVDQEVKAELSASFEARLKTMDPKREKRQAELARARESFATQRQMAWNVKNNNEQLANRIILARERIDGFVAERTVLNKEAEVLLKLMCQCLSPDIVSIQKLKLMCHAILERGSSG